MWRPRHPQPLRQTSCPAPGAPSPACRDSVTGGRGALGPKARLDRLGQSWKFPPRDTEAWMKVSGRVFLSRAHDPFQRRDRRQSCRGEPAGVAAGVRAGVADGAPPAVHAQMSPQVFPGARAAAPVAVSAGEPAGEPVHPPGRTPPWPCRPHAPHPAAQGSSLPRRPAAHADLLTEACGWRRRAKRQAVGAGALATRAVGAWPGRARSQQLVARDRPHPPCQPLRVFSFPPFSFFKTKKEQKSRGPGSLAAFLPSKTASARVHDIRQLPARLPV